MASVPPPRNDDDHRRPVVVTPQIAAEAASWIARLHGPSRTPRMERDCLEWQQRSAAHRLAFERCTDTWQDVAQISLANAFASGSSKVQADGAVAGLLRSRWPAALAAGVLLSVIVLSVQYWLGLGLHSTGLGEHSLVVLDDGTRVSLNTDSRVRVKMGAERRTVDVERGEAYFEVVKDPRRPFVVRAGRSEVVALGTVFSVRLGTGGTQPDAAVAVTLIEGEVTVQATRRSGQASAKVLVLHPGERVRMIAGDGTGGSELSEQVDRPRLEPLVAWKRGEAVFDNVPLSDAIAELNRYNRMPVVIVGDPTIGSLRISGVYRTGDTAGFARDAAALHGLVVVEHEGRLELTKPQ
jgi:transmembrane sensor